MIDPAETASDSSPPDSGTSAADAADSRPVSRRRTLAAIGSVFAAVSLAGCRDTSPDGETGDGSPVDEDTTDDGADTGNETESTDDAETDDRSTDNDEETDDRSTDNDEETVGDSDDEETDDGSADELSEPVQTVAAYFEAVNSGDLEQAQTLFTTDAPMADSLPDDPEKFAERATEFDIQFIEGSVAKMTEGERAVVSAIAEVSANDTSREQPYLFELRPEGEKWLIWNLLEEINFELPDVEGRPVAFVRAYLRGYTGGSREILEQTTHPDSPSRESVDNTDDKGLDQLGAFVSEYQIREITVTEHSEGRLVLDVTTLVAAFGEVQTNNGPAELRTYEGEWRIWEEDMLN